MITLLLSAALAVTPGDLSTERRDPTTVWIRPGARALNQGRLSRDCEEVPLEHDGLPVGLRAHAFVITPDCGDPYVFLDLPLEIQRERRSAWAQVRLQDVSLEPPRRSPWRGARSVGEAWVAWTAEKPIRAAPLDDPGWTELALLRHGTPVELLDPDLAVVRTGSGRVLALDPFYLSDTDPLATHSTAAERRVRDRFAAGRGPREARAPIVPLPPAAALADAPVGQVFELLVVPEALESPRYAPEWLEPVGHVLDHGSERSPDRGEPCGRYALDYGAFGAWRPDRTVRVLAAYAGTVDVEGERLPSLRVLVRRPWTDEAEVALEWDGAPDPADQ